MSEIIQPPGWPRPRGYSNGIKVPPGTALLFVAGQIGWNAEQKIVDSDFAAQFAQALDNAIAVVTAGGGRPQDIARMTIFVTNRSEYAAAAGPIGKIFKQKMQGHYPAMTLVEVAALLEDEAKVEIECTAAIEVTG